MPKETVFGAALCLDDGYIYNEMKSNMAAKSFGVLQPDQLAQALLNNPFDPLLASLNIK